MWINHRTWGSISAGLLRITYPHYCKLLVQPLGYWPIFLTAVIYILGFFQTQCGRSTSQLRLGAPCWLSHYLNYYLPKTTKHLKAEYLFLSYCVSLLTSSTYFSSILIGHFMPHFKAAQMSLLTFSPLQICLSYD